MKIIRNNLLGLCFCSLALAACSDSDEVPGNSGPMAFQATVADEASGTPFWETLLDRRIAVSVDGEVRKYQVDSKGRLTSSDPFEWAGRLQCEVEAWYPYTEAKPQEPKVKVYQNIESLYQASNLMETEVTPVTANEAMLSFTHLTSKVHCNLGTPEPATRAAGNPFAGARITLLNLKGVEEGTTVYMTSGHRAYIIDQVVPPGTEFMEVKLADGRSFTYTADEEFSFDEGQMYEMEVTLSPDEGILDVTLHKAPAWEGDAEDTPGNADGTESNTGSDDWGGGNNEDADGSSSDTNGSTGSDDWGGGNNEDTNGSSSDTEGSTGSDDWGGGNNEDTNGSSSDTNGSTGGDGWGGGNNEDTNGSTNDTNGDGTNGNWGGDGNNEDTEGNTSDTNGDGTNGSWNGSEEETTGTTTNTEGTTGGNWSGSGEGENITGTKNNNQ